MTKGDIYLVDFGTTKDSFSFGKKRPVLIFQTNKLNYAISEGLYEYLLVIPLSTQNDILTSDFRVKITKREELKEDSYAVFNSICFLHKRYFIKKLATLNKKEIQKIEKVLKDVFDIK